MRECQPNRTADGSAVETIQQRKARDPADAAAASNDAASAVSSMSNLSSGSESGSGSESESEDEMAKAIALSLGTASATSSEAMAAAASAAVRPPTTSGVVFAKSRTTSLTDSLHAHQQELDFARAVHQSIETSRASAASSESAQQKRKRQTGAAEAGDMQTIEISSDDDERETVKAIRLSLRETEPAGMSQTTEFHHSRRLQDKGSIFQAHATSCNDEADVRAFVQGTFLLVLPIFNGVA